MKKENTMIQRKTKMGPNLKIPLDVSVVARRGKVTMKIELAVLVVVERRERRSLRKNYTGKMSQKIKAALVVAKRINLMEIELRLMWKKWMRKRKGV